MSDRTACWVLGMVLFAVLVGSVLTFTVSAAPVRQAQRVPAAPSAR